MKTFIMQMPPCSYFLLSKSNAVIIPLDFLYSITFQRLKRNLLYIRNQSVPRCKHLFFNPLQTKRRQFI